MTTAPTETVVPCHYCRRAGLTVYLCMVREGFYAWVCYWCRRDWKC